MINRFVLNEVSYFGPGSRQVLPQEISRLGLHKAFVTSDKSLVQFGVTGMVLKVLDDAGIPYEVFSDIKPNPTVANVLHGVDAFAASGADFILAIGGGSSIDTSKAIGIISNNPEFKDVVSLEGVAPTKHKSVPIIALPTTAGTAAEVTINYVITDEKKEKKMVCVDPNDIPAIAIIDAELMYTLPKSLTASTGMDAMTHAIEGLITKAAWEMSDMFEIKAIEMIARYLPTAVAEPKNPEGRNGMAVAQYIAGMAFSNVGLGAVHGMAHPMSAIFDVPHGVACALLLPILMEYNEPACVDKYVTIAKAMGVYKTEMSEQEAADAAVKAVKDLSILVGIPQHLRDLGKGITENDLPRLAKAAMQDVCTPGNPREVDEATVLKLYQKAF
jgi:lactaldehyde reductase